MGMTASSIAKTTSVQAFWSLIKELTTKWLDHEMFRTGPTCPTVSGLVSAFGIWAAKQADSGSSFETDLGQTWLAAEGSPSIADSESGPDP